MSYAYIERTYGVRFVVGDRIAVDGRQGTVIRRKPSHAHYLNVRFDGETRGSNCHPTWKIERLEKADA